jgi:tryptophan synthase alpha chain
MLMKGPIRVMAHLVAGYPDDQMAAVVADSLVAGGVSYLEVQLPFSDPSADGTAIQKACSEVLARGYTVQDSLAFLQHLGTTYTDIPVFVMTYGNLAYRRGIGKFVEMMANAHVKGLIVPDLPFDHDEGLDEACKANGMFSVPVAAPSMTQERIQRMTHLARPYVYAALRSGITGSETVIGEDTIRFLDSIRGTSKVLGGFGIRNGHQAHALGPHVHAVVAGSVFVNLIATHASDGSDTLGQVLREKAAELSGLTGVHTLSR